MTMYIPSGLSLSLVSMLMPLNYQPEAVAYKVIELHAPGDKRGVVKGALERIQLERQLLDLFGVDIAETWHAESRGISGLVIIFDGDCSTLFLYSILDLPGATPSTPGVGMELSFMPRSRSSMRMRGFS